MARTPSHRRPVRRHRRSRSAEATRGRERPTLECCPATVRQGGAIVVRGRGWEVVPITFSIDGHQVCPTRVSQGTPVGRNVQPAGTGEFVVEIPTMELKDAKHRLTATSRHQSRPLTVEVPFAVTPRATYQEALERAGKRAAKGRPPAEDLFEGPYRRRLFAFQRRFGHLGFIPPGARETQIAGIRRLRERRDLSETPGPGRTDGDPTQPVPGGCNWTPVGAGPVIVSPTTAYSGRVLSIAFHPTNASIIYIGTANGGVWKSEDGGVTWTPKSDYQRSLAINSLTLDPNDSTHIVAGTGEFYGDGVGVFYGNGLLSSIDSGNTWTELATTMFERDEIARLHFDPTDTTSKTMFLASGTGVCQSLDGGTNWTVLRAGASSDLVLLINGSDVQLIAGCYGDGLYTATRTAGVWSAWTKYASPAFPAACQRIALGQSKNHPQTIYAAFSDGSSIAGMAKTTTGGGSWTKLTPPISTDISSTSTPAGSPSHTHTLTVPSADLAAGAAKVEVTSGPSAGAAHTHTVSVSAAQMQKLANGGGSVTLSTDPDATGHSHSFTLDRRISGQTWYNFHISPHPDDPNTVYYGEVRLWKTTTGDGPWTQLSILHTDNHEFGFEPSNPSHVWSLCDGGAYRSADGGTTWEHRNRDLATLEYISIAQHPQWETILIGGTQDNGTHRYTGSPAFEFSDGGDGGFTAIDQGTPTRMYHQYTHTTFYRSDASGTPGTWTLKNSGISGNSQFYSPFELDPSNPSACYFGGSQLWRSPNNGDSWTPITTALNGLVAAIAVHPTDSNTVYVATTNGHVYLVQKTGATWGLADVTTTDLTGPDLPVGVYFSDLAVDPAGTVWLTLSSILWSETTGEFSNDHVFRRSFGASTWESRSTGLAQANPINSIVIDPTNPSRLFCGGDVGVFRTENAGGMWVPWDEALPNTATFDLAIHGPRRLLRAATHGRSIWERPIDAATCPMVDLYMRDSILDSGRVQPTPEHVWHPFDSTIWVGHWQSEDIKVDGPEPNFQTPSPIDNYVAFATLTHRTTRRGNTNRFYVQVHNRGINTAHNVKVRGFFAPASSGLPGLPADFWSAGKPFTGTPAGPDWTPVGATIVLGDIQPGQPGVAEWDWFVPNSAPQHSCLLAVATCDEDPLDGGGLLDPDALVLNRKHVTLKNLHVEDAVAGSAMSPEQAFVSDMRAGSRDHRIAALRFQWGTLPRATKVYLAFSLADQGQPAVLAKPDVLKRLGVAVSSGFAKLFPVKVEDHLGKVYAIDRRRIYVLTRGENGMTLIPSITLPASGPLKVMLNFVLPPNARKVYRFDLVQLRGNRVCGGVTYQVRGVAKRKA